MGMFCSKCGHDCGDAKFCPACGQKIQNCQILKGTDREQPDLELEAYYCRYRPDRAQATAALRIDTGMGAVEAQSAIDLIFDFHENQQRGTHSADGIELEAEGKAYCPECLSTSIALQQKNRNHWYPLGCYHNSKVRTIAGALRLAGILAEKASEQITECVCLKCGHKWRVN